MLVAEIVPDRWINKLAALTGKNAESLVKDLEGPFVDLRDRYRPIYDIVFGRYRYDLDISPDLANRISVTASALRFYLSAYAAELRDNLVLHLEPKENASPEQADRMEKMQSHDLLMLDPKGHHRADIWHYQGLGPFWAGWLEMHGHLPPIRLKDESSEDWTERAKKARLSAFLFEIVSKPPLAVAFMESNHKLNIASTRTRVPFLDLMERYGESYNVTRDDPDHMLQICREHFPFIRTDEGRPYEHSDWDSFTRADGEVLIAADANKIWHYIDLGGRDGRGRYTAASDRYATVGEGEYDNPLGDVPLMVISGAYNPHESVAYRREGGIHSLIEIEHAKSHYKSYMASVAANPPERYEQPADAIIEALLEMPPEQQPPLFEFTRGKDGKPLINRSLGNIREADRKIDEMMDKLYGIFEQETRIVSPLGVLFSPDANQQLQNIPVTSVIMQQDAHTGLFGKPKRYETNEWSRALDMLMHARKNVMAKKNPDWGYSFKMTGEERVKGKRITAGESVEVDPADYEGSYTRSIESYDDRYASRSARRAEADAAYAKGMLPYDKYAEAYDIENVSEHKEKQYIETIYQIEAPRQVLEVRSIVAQITAIMNGGSMAESMAGIGPEVAPQLAGAFGMQQGLGTGSNVNMVQVASPMTEGTGQGTTSQQQVT